jgi:hypothetical protein
MMLPKYTGQLDKKTHVFYSFSESDYRYIKDLYRFAIESFTANSPSDKKLQAIGCCLTSFLAGQAYSWEMEWGCTPGTETGERSR